MSLRARDWIETERKYHKCSNRLMSLRAGDWIETSMRQSTGSPQMSLRAGDWIETTSSEAMS